MAVQRQMFALAPALEGGDQVGHPVVGRDDAEFEALAAQEIADEAGGLRRVARRIRALAADEAPEEIDDAPAFLVDPIRELPAVFAHARPVIDIPCRLPERSRAAR